MIITRLENLTCRSILLTMITALIFCLPVHSNMKITETQLISARPVVQLPDVLVESSGIYVSNPNRIWSHNDSGNTNELFCFDTTGVLLRTLLISNATNVDWEELAVDDQGRLYINDAGNNRNDRTDLVIYRIPNPETIMEDQVNALAINFIFEDQYQFPPPETNLNFDIEAMIWKDDSLFLFTKNRSMPQTGYSKMYGLPAHPGIYTAKLIDSVYLGETNQEARVTAADFNPETGELLLLTRTKIVSFTNFPGNRFFLGDMAEYYFDTPMGQIEALAFVNNTTLYITEETGRRTPAYLYEVKWQDLNTSAKFQRPNVRLFPNPFTSELIIERHEDRPATLEVWDIHGKLVKQLPVTEQRIALQHLSAGVYFIRLSIENESISFRVIKN